MDSIRTGNKNGVLLEEYKGRKVVSYECNL